jgi:nitric oxide dioxygenase
MTPEDILTVRASFARLMPRKVEAAALFYGRLFDLAPELKAQFADDLPAQAARSTATLAYLVAALDRPEHFEPFVAELSALAALQLGFQPAHYARAGEALLWTLRQVLEGAFNSQVAAAWARAYGLVAAAMIDAAKVDAIAA